MAKLYPPKPRLTLRVGITGHRPKRLAEGAEARLRTGIKDLLQTMQATLEDIAGTDSDVISDERPQLRAVSPLAEGADRIFAKAARELGVPLFAPLPFLRDDYEQDFPEERAEFRDLLAQATVFEFAHSRDDVERAYEITGLFVLRQCDLFVTVWDGQIGSGQGGTQEIIAKAIAAGVPIIRFDERGDGPWILSRQVLQRDAVSSDLLRGAVAATQDQIVALITSIVAPPSQPEERNRLRQFLNETERSSNFWFAYPLLQRLLTPWRRFRQSFHPEPYASATEKEWRRDFWIPFSGADSRSTSSTEELARAAPRGLLGLVAERYAWADKLAVHLAQVYRSSYVFIFMLGAFTVACALLPVLFKHAKPYSTIAEFALIGAATLIVVIGAQYDWHRRWLDYRLLAEQLRALRLLSLTGSNAAQFRVAHADESKSPQSWVNWYFRATAREVEMPRGTSGPDYVAAIARTLVRGEIGGLLGFHSANFQRQTSMEHKLDMLGTWLFALTTAILIAYLELYLLDWLAGLNGAADPWSPWVTYSTALLPSLGAALFAIRVQGDFDESARQSDEMTARLESLKSDVERETQPDFVTMSRLVEHTADALTTDLAGWRLIYRGKPLTLAG